MAAVVRDLDGNDGEGAILEVDLEIPTRTGEMGAAIALRPYHVRAGDGGFPSVVLLLVIWTMSKATAAEGSITSHAAASAKTASFMASPSPGDRPHQSYTQKCEDERAKPRKLTLNLDPLMQAGQNIPVCPASAIAHFCSLARFSRWVLRSIR